MSDELPRPDVAHIMAADLAASVLDVAHRRGGCEVSFAVLARVGLGFPHTADPDTGAVLRWSNERLIGDWCRTHGLRVTGGDMARRALVFMLSA